MLSPDDPRIADREEVNLSGLPEDALKNSTDITRLNCLLNHPNDSVAS